MNNWGLAALFFLVALCLVAVLWQRHKTQKTMRIISQMLDHALNGSFQEHLFDESTLSALACKFKRYLSASAISASNVATEKEKIKELLADISHQTKTPLTNILLYAQLLEEHPLDSESRACVEALRKQSEKLRFLIASLVKLSRLETGVFTFYPATYPIAPMLEEMVQQFLPKATQKQLQLILHPTQAHAIFDSKWTMEALENLVDNAIKYTPAGGSITLSVTEYDLFLRIDIADTGIGIAENEQAKIFLRFFRSSTASEQEGVGIGLYLARQIIAGQGGYIKVASKLDSGSVFSVFLPQKR